ncbi:MAG: transcriptional regulator, TetR family [Firmicutes bacterium]|nr:transcriptional regulator, TetR family [Bacillota bacterium]
MKMTQADTLHDASRTKRQQILDAAYTVFSRKGFHRATVDEIIALADTGKGTVYNYFTNKEQLFYTLVTEKSVPFEHALGEVARSPQPVLMKIENMIRLFLRFYLDNGGLWRVLMHEMRGFGSERYSALSLEQREKHQNSFRETIGMLQMVLDEGIQNGVFKECDTKKAAYALFSVIITMVFQNFIDDDIEDTAHMIADVFFYGVAKVEKAQSATNG